MKEIKIKSTNGLDELHVTIWEPEGEIKAILQISHGMVEYIQRYAGLAEFLNTKGILVIGNDHLGHGQTAATDYDLGYFGPGLSRTVVDDLHKVTLYAKKTYGLALPYILFGHSMGSFMARRYMIDYGNELNGAIISGTGAQPKIALVAGGVVATAISAVKGPRHRSELLRKLAMGAYNNKIENPRTDTDWISRDEELVDRYNQDKFCTFRFTANGYKTLFDSISYIQERGNVSKMPKKLPVFIISGTEDPVGNYGKSVGDVYESYLKLGCINVDMKLYEGCRHELTNELNKQEVFEDIYEWIEKKLLA